jgi:hypothetical protein
MSPAEFIDILGTFSFAFSGAFAAMEKRLDSFGVFILAFITAIGGGRVRDLLIGDTPVAWLRNPLPPLTPWTRFVYNHRYSERAFSSPESGCLYRAGHHGRMLRGRYTRYRTE